MLIFYLWKNVRITESELGNLLKAIELRKSLKTDYITISSNLGRFKNVLMTYFI